MGLGRRARREQAAHTSEFSFVAPVTGTAAAATI
jgi:hypothetical protein